MTAMRQATYSPAVFNVQSMDQAKRVILTTEGKLSTEERWRTETPYLVDLIAFSMPLSADSIVLDYGCGIGRMAKALIERFGCRVVGVDISPSMRALAASYVSSERFLVCAPEALEWLGIKFDASLSVWVLQHCHKVEDDIARILDALKPDGRLFVVNDKKRIVPTREQGWANDGKNVLSLLQSSFATVKAHELDEGSVGIPAKCSYWAECER